MGNLPWTVNLEIYFYKSNNKTAEQQELSWNRTMPDCTWCSQSWEQAVNEQFLQMGQNGVFKSHWVLQLCCSSRSYEPKSGLLGSTCWICSDGACTGTGTFAGCSGTQAGGMLLHVLEQAYSWAHPTFPDWEGNPDWHGAGEYALHRAFCDTCSLLKPSIYLMSAVRLLTPSCCKGDTIFHKSVQYWFTSGG